MPNYPSSGIHEPSVQRLCCWVGMRKKKTIIVNNLTVIGRHPHKALGLRRGGENRGILFTPMPLPSL